MPQASESQPEVVVKHSCLLGEGPVWDARCKTICWIDILNGYIHEYSTIHETLRTILVHQMIGSIAICTNGNFIAAVKNGLCFINRHSGDVSMIGNPESHLPNNRFNDGKCDPAGRFWAGTMAISEAPHAGNLYVTDRDLSITKKIAGVSLSNGMAWSPDHKTMYYIDTPTSEITSYDYDESTGNITNKKIAIKIPEHDGHPDGMTIDNEGMLWIAHWDGWQVTRWNPRTAEKLYTVSLPVARVSCCTFGGENLSDLYITSARKELTEEELKMQPLAGSLFVIRNSGFKGMPAFEFSDKNM